MQERTVCQRPTQAPSPGCAVCISMARGGKVRGHRYSETFAGRARAGPDKRTILHQGGVQNRHGRLKRKIVSRWPSRRA